MGKATIRRSLKTIAMNFPSGSIERVYLHGMWQKERKRNPTLLFGNHTDSRRAFAAASAMAGEYLESVRALPYSRTHDWSQWVENIIKRRAPEELYD